MRAGVISCRRSYVHIPNDYVEANGIAGSPTIGTVPDAPSTNGDVRAEVGLLEGLRQRSAALESSKRGWRCFYRQRVSVDRLLFQLIGVFLSCYRLVLSPSFQKEP